MDLSRTRRIRLQQAFDAPVLLPLDSLPSLEKILNLLFEEAFAERCGQQTALDRLCELVIIQLVRHLMDHKGVDIGLLAGLADPRLAEKAGMSRARLFSQRKIQVTPGVHAQLRLIVTVEELGDQAPYTVEANDI